MHIYNDAVKCESKLNHITSLQSCLPVHRTFKLCNKLSYPFCKTITYSQPETNWLALFGPMIHRWRYLVQEASRLPARAQNKHIGSG